MLTEVFRLLEGEESRIPIAPAHLAAVADMLGAGEINSGVSKKLIQEMWDADRDPRKLVAEQDLGQISDEAVLSEYVLEVLAQNPKAAEDYKKGKDKAFQSLIGQMMAKTKGKGNPVVIQKLLLEKLGGEKNA
jgi:aspartyl-tRNA(Asn)/glutamyl-tRNA(Gln) amidotransferase subunit B